MNNSDIAKEWFETAELDYGSASFLLKMKPMPFEIICYHCQQCAEKYLKGFIAYRSKAANKEFRSQESGVRIKAKIRKNSDKKYRPNPLV